MTRSCKIRLLALVISVAAAPAMAQSTTPPAGSEAGSQSSTMGLPPDDNAHANNGVGTAGSLDHDHGTASSTVTGTPASQAKTGSGNDQGASKPLENDPALGGGSQAPK